MKQSDLLIEHHVMVIFVHNVIFTKSQLLIMYF